MADRINGHRVFSALVVVALVALAILVALSLGGSDGAGAPSQGEAAEKQQEVSDTQSGSSSFDMELCLKQSVQVPVGQGNQTERRDKGQAVCDRQARLAGRNPVDDLKHAKAVEHHGQDGTVVYKGVLGLNEAEQVGAFYQFALEDPLVAAQILDCWTSDQLNDDLIDSIRNSEHGSEAHETGVQAVHALLINPETSLNDFDLYGRTYNEGVAPREQITATPTSHSGTAAVQVSVPTMVTPDGVPITATKSVQLKRCINCNTEERPANVVITPTPGVIPPGVTPPGPGPGPGPNPTPEDVKDVAPVNAGDEGAHHDGGHGADPPSEEDGPYQGPPPTQGPSPNPPVVTPTGTGGSIPPGGPPPPNDSGGGTVSPPTAQPTPQPDPAPPGSSPPPPPAPEDGAPPPP